MADPVLALLQSRPWLFTVAPHGGIAVTRRAREGLVYKRDVITYLYNALQDGVTSVTVAELGERVQQPHGITDVVLVSTLWSCCSGLAATGCSESDLSTGCRLEHRCPLTLRSCLLSHLYCQAVLCCKNHFWATLY